MSDARMVSRASWLLMAGTLAGRVLGFIREALLARRFGLGEELDVLVAALSVPDLLTFFLMGTATSAAIVPYLAKQRANEARGVLASESSALLDAGMLVFLALGCTGALAAGPMIDILAPGLDTVEADRAQELTRWAMIGVLFTGLTLVQGPILQASGHFRSSAFATASYNTVIVAGLLVLWPLIGTATVIGITIFASVVRWLLHERALRQLGLRWRPFLHRSPGALAAVAAAMPAAMAVSLSDIGILVDRHYASLRQSGALAAVTLADRLVALPLGVVAGSIAVAALPALAASRQNTEAFRRLLAHALWRAVGFATVTAVGLVVLHQPLVALAFGGGAFTDAEVVLTAKVLACYAPSMPFVAAGLVLGRAAFAWGNPWIAPVAAGLGLFVRALWQHNIVGNGRPVTDLALGATVGAVVQVCALVYWYHWGRRPVKPPAEVG